MLSNLGHGAALPVAVAASKIMPSASRRPLVYVCSKLMNVESHEVRVSPRFFSGTGALIGSGTPRAYVSSM